MELTVGLGWGGRRMGLPAIDRCGRLERGAFGIVAVLALVGPWLAGVAMPKTATPPPTGAPTAIIVVAAPGGLAAATAAVEHAGGHFGRPLGIINGFQAIVPAGAVSALGRADGIAGVSLDTEVRPQAASYDATTDVGSTYSLARTTGAVSYWKAGVTGAGVGVALIDSGVAPVDGLTTAGKVVNGPDLSFESQAPNLTYLDSYGHGTHMAGIIAGRANAAVPGTYATDTTNFLGMAPDASIVSVKVADAQGATDVSQVIAAIDWVVQHKNDPGMNIRVLNLSYGTDSTQSYKIDPLSFAAEQAWKAGIFVVASTGNAGFVNKNTSTITNPAFDPNIMAVGAADSRGTVSATDDSVATFSSTGTDARRPDLVAPGTHVVSLRVPGSSIDQQYSSTGAVTDTLFRGSGTSQAAAVVSGAAALIIQQRPTISPGQLKALLDNTATSLKDMTGQQQGKGEVNLAKVLTQGTPGPAGTAPWSTGTGSLESARGTSHLVNNGVTLSGEQDIFGVAFNSAAMAQAEASGSSWSGGTWNGSSWSGSSWSGSSWSGSSWSGSSWSGSSWSGSSWSGSSWSDNTWSGSSWSGSSWSGSSWSGSSWSGSSWSSDIWADASWD
jgi:serine protease AprX